MKIDALKEYIAGMFQPGMSWNNWGNGIGKWNIDHRKPLVSFDLSDPIQQKQAFHYTNLQPLWWEDNMTKGQQPDFVLDKQDKCGMIDAVVG